MKKKHTLKTVLASILVTVALAAPITIISSAEDPYDAELIFEVEKDGGLVFHQDGSVQLLVNVAVDKAVNCRGASFHLIYNRDYLTPSYAAVCTDDYGAHIVNEALADHGVESLDGFFRPAELLGPGQNAQVFKEYSNALVGGHFGQEYYSHVDVGAGTIDMDLWFDNESISAAVGGADSAGRLAQLSGVSNTEENVYVFNKRDENAATNQTVGKVILGQLSFRVNNGRLAEIIDLFDGLEVASSYRDPAGTPARPVVDLKTPDGTVTQKGVRLIDIDHEGVSYTEDPWQVGYYDGDVGDRYTMHYSPDMDNNIVERYIFHFDRDLVVDVALTEPDFTINAYQNFTAGNTDDLALSMGRWAGMVTVTYADGRKVNEPFPWGRAESGYTAQYVKKDDFAVGRPWREQTATAITPYDPTANDANPGVGTDYVFSQFYQTYQTDETGAYRRTADGKYQVEQTFPIPVVGHMRVTPIQVLSVTAEDLTRTYLVSDVTDQVTDPGDLALPAQARIVTDIVPGNVSLVTPIHGWKPVQPDSWQPGQPEVSTWPGASLHTLKAKTYNPDTGTPYWPDPSDRAATQAPATQTNFIGDYSFETSAADHQTAQGILKADIQAQFPWLTVPQESYQLERALRRIVSRDSYVDPNAYEVDYVSTVTESSLTANGGGQPTLTLSVERADDQNMDPNSVFRVWLPNGLELGTGQNAGGVAVDNWFSNPGGGDHVNGFYNTQIQTMSTSQQYFHLRTNPADPAQPLSTTAGDEYHNGHRETLRRYINLGGWYRVAICEDPGTGDHWTDPIPVYVPPRPNEYQESKIYNFVAENQGLFRWPGDVGSVLAFPRGDYDPVAPDLHENNSAGTSAIGLPLYDVLDADGAVSEVATALTDPTKIFAADAEGALEPYVLKENVRRHSESYGVETTYDGQTGAQPGMVYTVKVDEAIRNQDEDWNAPDNTERTHATVGNDPVTRRGATPLQDDYRVTGFGTVNQPQGEAAYQATLRTQGEERTSQELLEKITLTSQADDGITRQPPGTKADNVTLVTFNTVTEGYTVRQSHLLTINNVGDVDIYGLDIDSLVDGYALNDNSDRTKPEGGHFEITMPPASFLPAGASTNFILTYVYDLRANVDTALNYRDTLYITSTSHPDAGQGEDYLLDFDAELTVSANPLHQVTVIYRPTDGTMGTAALIVGEESAPGGAAQMNTTSTTRTYAQGDRVYVEVQPLDEYEVKAIHADGTGVDVVPYSGAATLADGTEVYVFDMPNRDVTVYVDFYEPITSKLRLDELVDFSAPGTEVPGNIDLVKGYDPAGNYQPADPGHIYQVWKKQFTDQDRAEAAAWSAGTGNGYDEDFYLMTAGSAITAAQGGNVYDSSNAHYLVVIDSEDDFSQIKATLRNVKYHVDWRGLPDPSDPSYDAKYANGYNLDVKPTVNMVVYYQDQVRENWTGVSGKAVYDNGHGYGPYDASGVNGRPQGSTADNTQHLTGHYDNADLVSFESPAPGESAYVHITITYPGDSDDQPGQRDYYVEIHRPTAETQAVLHYGNSPYGMIMNDSAQFPTPTVQNIAKSAFRAGYTFRGADVTVLPTAAKGKLQSVTYWREAWVRNQGLFEPESQTGFHQVTGSGGAPLYQNSAGETVTPGEDGSLPEDARSVYAPDGDVYNEADNLDLNDYAFFAILGREMWEPGVVSAKDSSGRDVDLLNIHARALDRNGVDGVTLLDTGATSQVDRFSGTEKAVIDLGVAGQKLTPAGGAVSVHPTLGVTQWPVQTTVTTRAGDDGAEETVTTYQAVENIRPGRYLIEYSYYDFDGETLLTVTRPLVILREVGDVNADGARNAIRNSGGQGEGTDEYAIEDRVTHDPLGYEAGGWDAAGGVETVYPSANIFKFRVADVNNDRNINNIDANQIAKNVKDGDTGWLQFYDPEDYGHPGAPITAP